jgi:hypothetical protein
MSKQTQKIFFRDFFNKERIDKLAELWLSPPAPPEPVQRKKKVVKSA